MKYVLEMGRAHVNETSETEWVQELEIAGDAFRKANGDLMRELVQAGMDAGNSHPETRRSSRRWSPR